MKYQLSLFDRVVLRHLTRKARTYKTTDGMAVYAHDHIGTMINLQGVYEGSLLQALMQFLPRRTGVVIDAGANIGNHSNWFAQHFDRVEAFEPHPRTFKLLEFNAASNVNVHNCALGKKEETATLFDLPCNMGGSSLKTEHGGRRYEVKVDTIDRHDFANVCLIKIDVEGLELSVLKGAEQTIRKCRPIIVFEQLHDEFDGDESPTIRFLRQLDYDIHWSAFRSRLSRLWTAPYFTTGTSVPAADHSMIVALPRQAAN